MSLLIAGVLGGLTMAGIAVLIPVFKTVAEVYPYSYTNARLRSMRPQLVTDEELRTLASKSYSDIIYFLEKKNYPGLSDYLGVDFSYASVETALRTSLLFEFSKLKRIVPEQSRKFVQAVLSSFDVQIIQSIARVSGASLASKKDILHITEVFSAEFITKKEHTLDDLYNELKGSIYFPIISKHLDSLKKKNFKDFELELDLLLYKRLLHTATSSFARGYVKRQIDLRNISLAFKQEKAIIPGGKIPLEDFVGKKQVVDVVTLAQKHGYKIHADHAETVERELQRNMRDYGLKMMAKNPLSEASIVGFTILKQINMHNINILLKLKYHDYPAERIREVMI